MGNTLKDKPLEGVLVIDFSQFLSGPSAGLRLADLGARVIKIERPETGDICRTLYISNLEMDGDSSIFHAINRNKESFACDLKNTEDILKLKELLKKADVVIQNFRPGVMEKLGFDYEAVKGFNPSVVYGQVTGYGTEGPWKDKPGQDLLVQARSGLVWLSGNDQPSPLGLSIVDMAAGVQLTQGILAALVRKSISGQGALVEVSLLESILDFQVEGLSIYLNENDRNLPLVVPPNDNVHSPFGIYETADGYLTLVDGPPATLVKIIGRPDLADAFKDRETEILKAREIKRIISSHFKRKPKKELLKLLDENGMEASEVFTWNQLIQHEGFQVLDMLQEVKRTNGMSMLTTRCPIRIDGQIYKAGKGSPRLGEDTLTILKEFVP
ncbi:CoA transferase [Mesobacillus foraminis]|uniref:CaiB/BaiF CoA transferase family protein n=1 Tax=Mesobacillus foraminis TaxID=279826 RepID=UPI001BE98F02|nr:CaiB/BaiF CoA-transferase family protein [Mesobacillus foraminis]MBT2757789.1 CoA transferase [Mesobacillus foraminis]